MSDDVSDAQWVTPFNWIRPTAELRVLVALTLAVASLSMWLGAIGEPLITDAAPDGIITFELARTAEASQTILDSWDAPAREAAMFLQGVDFLYLLVYPAWFSLASIMVVRRLGGAWAHVGRALAWAVLLAAPLDVVENLALVQQLNAGADASAAWLAWACAVPKFALVFAGAIFVVAGGIVALFKARPAAA